MRKITNELILSFKNYLIEEGKSENTIEKYIRIQANSIIYSICLLILATIELYTFRKILTIKLRSRICDELLRSSAIIFCKLEKNYDYRKKKYLDKLISKKDNGPIKVVTGIRRCGKSFLLFKLYHKWWDVICIKRQYHSMARR